MAVAHERVPAHVAVPDASLHESAPQLRFAVAQVARQVPLWSLS
jgi:hypothetical protein